MGGGFRDTFTKDEQNEAPLGYDDTAFYYFAASLLLCVAVPWTFNVLYNLIFPGQAQVDKDFPVKTKSGKKYVYCQTSKMLEKTQEARKEARRSSRGSATWWLVKTAFLGLIWACLYAVIYQMGEKKEIKHFDPFRILELEHSATNAEVKKAYRRLSMIYHPDKNRDDPHAASRFIEITRANMALTDEVAKRNWERYGNPDGPQTTKVGIGLPRFLLEKENHLMILAVFFFLLIFVLPMTFICYYQRTKHYAATGVLIETLQFLGYWMLDATRVKHCPELLAASAESRGMEMRAADAKPLTVLQQQVVLHKKIKYTGHYAIVKNQLLVWAHMQRLHHLMTPAMRNDCDQLLKFSTKITQAMIEIACVREWFTTAQAMIEFRRCLIQALDVKSSQLLQIPHFTEDTLKYCHKGKNAVNSLPDFCSRDAEQRKGISRMEPQELEDIEAFAAHVTDAEVKAVVEVEDEEHIVVGDIATVTIQMLRKNLKEGEASGPVHAPFFPEPKFEEWWFFLVEVGSTTRIIAFEKVRDPERLVEEKLRFQVSKPGKHSLVLHALCDSYAGIDQKVDLTFHAYKENEVKRESFLHKEDEELDLQPTLFQQFMGDVQQDAESEEEEEEDVAEEKVSDGKVGDGGGKAAKDDESSDSSSDSE